MKQNVSSSKKSWVSVKQLIIPIIAAFFVTVTVYATTTLGDNISTGGTLDVTGLSTLASLKVTGTASSTALIVGGTATTTKLIVGERAAANATTTVLFGDLIAESAPCIKLRTTSGAWVYAYPTSSASMASVQADGSTFGLNWTTVSCE